jgi:hypothetical protein
MNLKQAVVKAAGQGSARELALLVERDADPELAAAWPPARAILIAAFSGQPAVCKNCAPERW